MKKRLAKTAAFILSIILIISSFPIFALANGNYFAKVGRGFIGDYVVYPGDGDIDISYCEYEFIGNSDSGKFVNRSTGRDIYLTIDNNNAGCPGATSSENLFIGVTRAFPKKNTFYIKNNSSSRFLDFWDDNGEKKYRFDRRGEVSQYSQSYFSLFTPDKGNITSGIYGYKRITSLSELTTGKKVLITHPSAFNDDGSVASGGSMFVLYPSLSTNPYEHVAKVFNKSINDNERLLPITAFGTVKNGTNRANGANLNIVNDRQDGNFDVGFINIDISSVDCDLTAADYTFKVTTPSDCENKGITVYYATKNTSEFTGFGANINKTTDIFGFGEGTHLQKAIDYYGLNAIKSITPTKNTSNVNYTVDLLPVIKEMQNAGSNKISLVFATTSAGNAGNSGGWTDTTVIANTNPVSAAVNKENEETTTEAFGLIKYDPVIYTMGFDYMCEGNTIAHGTETFEGITNYTVKDGYSVVSIDSSNASDVIMPTSKTGTGYLTGRLGGVTASSSKYTVLTTKLVDENGNYFIQKDKLFVESNPVPAHAVGGAYSWKFAMDTYYSDYVGFNLVAENSRASYGGGSSNSNQAKGNGIKDSLTTALYSRDTFADYYYREYSFTETNVKPGGCYGYYKCNASLAIVRVTAPNANYYLDLSSNDNRGITKSATGEYYFNITYLPQIVYDSGRYWNFTYSNVSESNNDFSTKFTKEGVRTGNTGTKEVMPININNTSIGAHSGTFSFKEEAVSVPGAYLTCSVPFTVNIYDKSKARKAYNEYINKGINSEIFLPSSWANYSNSLLELQAYINKYDEYDTAKEEQLVANVDKAFEDLKCNVTLNHADGTSETVLLNYLSEIPISVRYEESDDDETKHIKYYNSWEPSIVTGEITATESKHSAEENHEWNMGVVIKSNTCTEDGQKMYFCRCKKTKIEVLEKTGHTQGETVTENEVPSTCIKQGSYDRVKHCTVCNEIVFSQTVMSPLAEHTYQYSFVDKSTHTGVCSVCNDTVTENHTMHDGMCTKCGYMDIDTTAYDAAISEYKSFISADDYEIAYTESSRRTYENLVNGYIAEKLTSQSDYDSFARYIVNAKSRLRKNTYEVSFGIVKEDGSVSYQSVSGNYDEAVELTVNSNIRKWTSRINGADTLINNIGNTYMTVVKPDMKIFAFETDEEIASDVSKVIFVGKSNKIVDIVYLNNGERFDTADVLVPDVPFYNTVGWSQSSVTGDGSEMIITAVYEAK